MSLIMQTLIIWLKSPLLENYLQTEKEKDWRYWPVLCDVSTSRSENADFSERFDLKWKLLIKFTFMTHHIDNLPFCNSGFLQDAKRFHNAANAVQNMHKAMRQK